MNTFPSALINDYLKIAYRFNKIKGIKKIIQQGQVVLVASSYSAVWTNYGQVKPLNAFYGVLYDSASSKELNRITYSIRHKRTYDATIGKDNYWIAYADNLYEYDWNGNLKIICRFNL